MASDASLAPHTICERRHVRGTSIAWNQPSKILPLDPRVRAAILEIEQRFEAHLSSLGTLQAHLPSRVRSLVWIAEAIPVLRAAGMEMPSDDELAGLHVPLPIGDAFVRRLLPAQNPIDASPSAGAERCGLQ